MSSQSLHANSVFTITAFFADFFQISLHSRGSITVEKELVIPHVAEFLSAHLQLI